MKFRKFFFFSSSVNCRDFFFIRERKMILRKFHLFSRLFEKSFFFLESKERQGWAKSVPGCLQMGCYCCRSNIRVCIGWNNQNIILRLEKHALMDSRRRRFRLSPRSRTNYPYISKHSSTFLPFFLSIFIRSSSRNRGRYRLVPKKEDG